MSRIVEFPDGRVVKFPNKKRKARKRQNGSIVPGGSAF